LPTLCNYTVDDENDARSTSDAAIMLKPTVFNPLTVALPTALALDAVRDA
jgi:hypothetical protein